MEQFSKMNNDEKRLFIDGLFVTFIENKEASFPETESDFSKGTYVLIAQKQEDLGKIWESLNAYETKFGEELRSL